MTTELRAAQQAHRKAHRSQVKAADDVLAMKAAVRAARDAGHSLDEIGKALGVSKQRIHTMLG
jgi:DNA-directed RNA polymerase sigma subunit (sigma70/sigma32)